MKRVLLVLGCLVAGLAVGLGGALALDDGPAPSTTTVPPPTTQVTATLRPPTTTAPVPTTVPAPVDEVLLAWTTGGLPAGFADAVDALPAVRDLTVVRGDLAGLVATRDDRGREVDRTAPGWELPFDLLAVDPARFATFAEGRARRILSDLGPGEAVLGATSAELRGLQAGATLQLTVGGPLRVRGVVPDEAVAGAEAVVDLTTGVGLGVDTDRYLLVHHRDDRDVLADAIRPLAGQPVQIRALGETPFLRHADAVLPQVVIKDRFGEFAYRRTGPGPLEIDPAWIAANIVTVDLPILGSTRCHRALVPPLRGVLDDLEAANLGHLVASYEGCYLARTVNGSSQISRHTWGAAVDVNFSVGPTGTTGAQDPRLVEVFERWGFGSGDAWLVPDSGHFEHLARPAPG